MSVVLLVLGIVAAASGVVTIGFGIPINEFTLGTTLILAGTTALTGGLILIGLSAVVSEIGRLAEPLKGRAPGRAAARSGEIAEPVAPSVPMGPSLPSAPSPIMRSPPPQAPVPPRARPEAPPIREPRPSAPAAQPAPSSVDVSAAAIERLRSTIPRTDTPRVEQPVMTETEEVTLSPNGAAQAQPARPASEPTQAERKPAAEERTGEAAAVENLKSSRLDFLFRSKPTRPASQPETPSRPTPQPENFDAIWPAEGRASRNAVAEPQTVARTEQIERRPEPAPPASERRPEPAPPASERRPEPASPASERRPEAPAPQAPRAPTPAILKSGVVDGMAYTLYADGSIEAKLPQGTMKFDSIAELRAHIESNS
jgi:hypothetical protein